MTPVSTNPADLLRAAAQTLKDKADRAKHKDRGVHLDPAEVRPISELLYAIADDMDFDGAYIRERHLPGGELALGVYHRQNDTYLHDWTWAWKLSREVLGDA